MSMAIITGLMVYLFYTIYQQSFSPAHYTPRNYTTSENESLTAGFPVEWLLDFNLLGDVDAGEAGTEGGGVGGTGGGVAGVAGGRLAYDVRVEPDWDTVLGSYRHAEDNGFKEYMLMSGVPSFIASIILETQPVITFKRLFRDHQDYDYDDYYVLKDRDNIYGDLGEGDQYQVLMTTATWIRTLTMRFQLGQPFKTVDADEKESQNVFWFAGPRVLLQDKTRGDHHHRVVYQFTDSGFTQTMVFMSKNFTARRTWNRIGGKPGQPDYVDYWDVAPDYSYNGEDLEGADTMLDPVLEVNGTTLEKDVWSGIGGNGTELEHEAPGNETVTWNTHSKDNTSSTLDIDLDAPFDPPIHLDGDHNAREDRGGFVDFNNETRVDAIMKDEGIIANVTLEESNTVGNVTLEGQTIYSNVTVDSDVTVETNTTDFDIVSPVSQPSKTTTFSDTTSSPNQTATGEIAVPTLPFGIASPPNTSLSEFINQTDAAPDTTFLVS